MSILDSEAVFHAKMQSMGLQAVHMTAISCFGWTTLASFAHSSAFSPGQQDDTVFAEKVLVPVLGSATHVGAARVRRLYFEAYTLMIAELKRSVERRDGDPPRHLPTAERASRLERVAARLVGLDVVGPMEPSNHLIDLVNALWEEDVIRYIEWRQCTTRSQEVNGLRREPGPASSRLWQADSAGVIREKSVGQSFTADIGSDLRLKQALARRGIALEVCALMTYEAHKNLVDKLFAEYQRPALPTYS